MLRAFQRAVAASFACHLHYADEISFSSSDATPVSSPSRRISTQLAACRVQFRRVRVTNTVTVLPQLKILYDPRCCIARTKKRGSCFWFY